MFAKKIWTLAEGRYINLETEYFREDPDFSNVGIKSDYFFSEKFSVGLNYTTLLEDDKRKKRFDSTSFNVSYYFDPNFSIDAEYGNVSNSNDHYRIRLRKTF